MNKITEAAINEILTRGVSEAIERRSLENKFRRHRPLRVKYGIDPTGYHLHLGHTVPLRKLRVLQDLGHQAVLVIGDYTAQVGDPGGKDKTRGALKFDQVKRFSQNYIEQVGHVLDLKKTEVRYNSEWYEKFTAADFLELLSRMTVNQLLAHETFRRRLDRGLPLGVHELTYPMLQGYDSVAIQADIELGGADQKFNVLAGRDIQAAYQQDQQDVILLDYLLGTDGKKKMSKTLDNYIAVDDTSEEMFGKTMSMPDKNIIQYFELLTDVDQEEVATIKKELKDKSTNPRTIKVRLAKKLVVMYHSQHAADQAEAEFSHVFTKKGIPTEMPTAKVRAGAHPILNLLVSHRLASSRSEARRLIIQGGVKVGNEKVTDWEASITVTDGLIIQVGKRKFLKLQISS